MKKKIRIVDKVSGKVLEGETEIRNLDHFEIQKRTRVHIYRPKKGRGSFRRNKKVDID